MADGPLLETKRLINALTESGLTMLESAERIAALTVVLQEHSADEILSVISLLEKTRDASDRKAAILAASSEVDKLPKRPKRVRVR